MGCYEATFAVSIILKINIASHADIIINCMGIIINKHYISEMFKYSEDKVSNLGVHGA